jgi:peptide/nickel transport system substrate-binding protein
MRRFSLTLVLLALIAAPAQAKTFRWAFQGDVAMMDPYGLFETLTVGFHSNIFEGLVRSAGDLSIGPALATEWSNPSPEVWRFTLRRGVTFHDGSAFTADDVVFSFERVRKPGSDFTSAVATVREVRKIDDFTVEIVTDGPDPILDRKLDIVFIMSKSWAEAHGAENPIDVRQGVENYATRHANGTGPFMLKSREPDVKTVLVPNPNWWDEAQHNVTEAVFTPIGSDATRVAALLSGELDLAYPVPLQDIKRIERTAGLRILQGPELRTIFLGMDQSRDELLYSSVKGANPFKDIRVRKAFYQAINIKAIHLKIMRGAATPTALMIGPGVNGFDEALNTRFPHDPEAARALLAEAGYGDGFRLGMDCPNDRYVNDEAICQAVAAGLAKIGVHIDLLAQTKSKYFGKILSDDTSFYLLGWTPVTRDALDPLYNLMATRGARGQGKFNVGRYSNPALDVLMGRIGREMDPARRQALISEAYALHKDDVGHIPLHQQALAWGVRDSVAVVQRADNQFQLRYVKIE